MTTQEIELLQLYDKLPPQIQDAFLFVVRLTAATQNQNQKNGR